ALLFEKIVACYSKQNIWIVDQGKMVEKLGKFPLPIEVIPYGSQQLFRLFESKQFHPTFRKTADGKLLETDAHHYIIDLHLEKIEQPETLGTWLNELPGVVEHGLFLNIVDRVIVGSETGVQTIETPKNS